VQKGGEGTAAAAIVPPELERDYPEPSRFGRFPAQALFIRHARNIEIRDVRFETDVVDARPFVWLGDSDGVDVVGMILPRDAEAPALRLESARNLRVADSIGVPDAAFALVANGSLP
jgi:hypothetical protein